MAKKKIDTPEADLKKKRGRKPNPDKKATKTEASAENDNKQKKKKKAPKQEVPYHRKPAELSLEAWQTALRKQFARQSTFHIQKISQEEVYADYWVSSQSSDGMHKVALRSATPGQNFCSCLDFKINRLGTCKHIEAVFALIEKKHLKRKLRVQVQRNYTSVYLDYKTGRTVKIRIGTTENRKMKELAAKYFDENDCLKELMYPEIDIFLREASSLDGEFRCYDDALEYIIQCREKVRRYHIVNKLLKKDNPFSKLLDVKLFPYQEEGALFAFANGRAIIGDEMGLGKTPQAIAVAELLRKYQNISKVLILTPTTIKYQWKTEIEKFTGDDSALIIEGPALTRIKQYRNSDAFYNIASYHAVLYDWQFIAEMKPDLIILDEAQRLKNWRTKIAASVRKIPSEYMVVLTGTPMENNIEELYGITQFADPFALGPRHEFLDRYQIKDQFDRVVGYDNLSEIKGKMKDILIRRTKKQVLKQLPARIDKNLTIPITAEQMAVHDSCADTVAQLVTKWHKYGFLDEKDRRRLLNSLNMMRMVCDTTFILDPHSNHQTKIDELFNILQEILEIEGEKVVIFSQWERMTRLVAEEFRKRKIEFRYLHGGVPNKDRPELYTTFNKDPNCRVFLSTDAGGVGLNLQSAAWMVNLDLPWNPGILEQRIGRIYRMGQEKVVNIINLIAHGTIEHNLLGVIQFKKSVAEGILDDGDNTIFLGDTKFKKFMQAVEEITRANPHTQEDSEFEDEVDAAEPAGHIADNDNLMPDTDILTPENPPVPEPGIAQPSQNSLNDMTNPDQAKRPHGDKKPKQQQDENEDTLQNPQALVKNGLNFLSQLTETLSNPDATRKLVESIVETDQETGKTFLKLPVENADTVTNALNLLGNLFKGFGK